MHDPDPHDRDDPHAQPSTADDPLATDAGARPPRTLAEENPFLAPELDDRLVAEAGAVESMADLPCRESVLVAAFREHPHVREYELAGADGHAVVAWAHDPTEFASRHPYEVARQVLHFEEGLVQCDDGGRRGAQLVPTLGFYVTAIETDHLPTATGPATDYRPTAERDT